MTIDEKAQEILEVLKAGDGHLHICTELLNTKEHDIYAKNEIGKSVSFLARNDDGVPTKQSLALVKEAIARLYGEDKIVPISYKGDMYEITATGFGFI